MRILLLLTSLLLFDTTGFSQTDSLWKAYNDHSKPDTVRLMAIGKMAWAMTATNVDSCILLGQLHLQMAEQQNSKYHIATAYNTIGVGYYMKGHYDKAIEAHTKSLEIKRSTGDTLGAAYSLGNLANIYIKTGKWEKAVKDYEEAAQLFGMKNKLALKAQALTQCGVVYSKQGNIPKAIKYMSSGLKTVEEMHDTLRIVTALSGLGNVYKDQGEYETSLSYHERALELSRSAGNRNSEAIALANIASIYQLRGEKSKALIQYEQARKIKTELGRDSDAASLTSSIASLYLDIGDTVTALENLHTALNILEAKGDKEKLPSTLQHIGSVYYHKKQNPKALGYLEKGLRLARETGGVREMKSISQLLYFIHKEQGNKANALQMYELYITMRDSIESEENQKAVIRSQYQYEYEKQALADSLSFAKSQEMSEMQHQSQLEKEKSQRYALYGGLGFLLVLGAVAYRGYRVKKKDNSIILQQKKEVQHQKEIVEEKNKEIIDSIAYANRIQKAILPPERLVKQQLPGSFVLYKPKDIVAGDFYWMKTVNDLVIFAAADCTGHGVPGALVSVVCNNALNRAVDEFGLQQPSLILDKTRELVIEQFEKSEEEVKDGMDIALCVLNKQTNQLQYSGANNSLYHIHDGKLTEIKADKQPIGKYSISEPFTNHNIQLQAGDCVYLFSDGFADQFGGSAAGGKKFKYSRFKELIVANHSKPMDEQKQLLDKTFEEWKGSLEQVDDVCVWGVKI